MAITRTSDYPLQNAQLLAQFNACAKGYDVSVVMDAAAHIVVAAINYQTDHQNGSLEEAEASLEEVYQGMLRALRHNWKREPQPGDIPVDKSSAQ